MSPFQPAAITGPQAAPNVPASTVALTNPFAFPCLVTVRGGTVSAVAVDGHTVGVTAGSVLVPVGKTIAMTYAVAPAWDWFGL